MNTITRKEIASMAGVSAKTVKRKESFWGLLQFRSKAKENEILYFRRAALNHLKKIGVVML